MQRADDENMIREINSVPDVASLVAEIVSAYVSGNPLPPSEVPTLIRQVHLAVTGLSAASAPAVEVSQRPAVSVKRSISDEAITCLECGVQHKMLRRHLMTSHGLTPREYRAKWNLAADYPLIAPNYSAQRSELATRIGLGKRTREVGVSRRRRREEGGQGALAVAASVPKRRGPGRPRREP